MAHYAFLDANNIVTEVIVGNTEGGLIDWESHYGAFRGQACKRTSFNTRGGVHPEGRPLRKNYAGIGFTYDAQRDAFITPKPFASWVLNEDTCLWDAPVAMPDDGKQYQWDEDAQDWAAVQPEPNAG
jgi:hypothetical protein